MNWKCAKFNNPKCVQGKAKTKLLQNLMEFASFSWNLKETEEPRGNSTDFLSLKYVSHRNDDMDR